MGRLAMPSLLAQAAAPVLGALLMQLIGADGALAALSAPRCSTRSWWCARGGGGGGGGEGGLGGRRWMTAALGTADRRWPAPAAGMSPDFPSPEPPLGCAGRKRAGAVDANPATPASSKHSRPSGFAT